MRVFMLGTFTFTRAWGNHVTAAIQFSATHERTKDLLVATAIILVTHPIYERIQAAVDKNQEGQGVV